MKAKALKRIWKEFPFVWAILQNWDFLICEVKIGQVNDDFINWLLKMPADNNFELWVKYRELTRTNADILGEGILKLTTCEDMSFSQALFRLSGAYIPEYLITKRDIQKIGSNI